MKKLITIVAIFGLWIGANSQPAHAEACFLLSSSPDRWDEASERLCIDRIFMLVDPNRPESPSNPRIEKTRIQLMSAAPLTDHVVATFLLDVLPSRPGSTVFGVSIPSNSIFRNLVVAFEEMDESDERDLRGRVKIGDSLFYYRSISFPEVE